MYRKVVLDMSEDSTPKSRPAIFGLLATTALIGGSIGIAVLAVYGLQWLFGF